MKLRILAPFRSHFRLTLAFMAKTGQLSVLPTDYLDFWDKAAKQIAEGVDAPSMLGPTKIQFLHSHHELLGSDEPRYTRIDTDAVRYTAEIIQIWPTAIPNLTDDSFRVVADELGERRPTGKKAFERTAPGICIEQKSLCVRVFDNTISLLQADLDITPSVMAPGAERDEYLDRLRETAVFIGEVLVLLYYRSTVFPLLKWLASEFGQENRIVDYLATRDATMGHLNDHGDTFHYPLANLDPEKSPDPEILWVTRSLICDAEDHHRIDLTSFVLDWLKDIGDNNKERAVHAANEADAYCVRWLNYVFREDFRATRRFEHVWEALCLCQYYYSALDALNDRLNAVISLSNRMAQELHVYSLREALDETVQRTAILLLNYNEAQNYMNRDKLAAVRDIMTSWEFERIERTTREKMKVCRERLDDLHRKSAEKSSRYTEGLLFGIGLLAILDLGISLAMFGRAPAESTFAQDERYTGFILAGLAGLPATAIILVSVLLIVALGLFYRRLRNKKRML